MFEPSDEHSNTGPELTSAVATDHVVTVTAFPPPPSPANRRPDHSGAQPVTDRRLRRLYGWETWVVMSIFPLGATIAAITYLLMHITIGVEFSDGGMVIPGEPGLSLALSIAVVLSGFAAAGLVFFLLIRNGEGLSSIGLSSDRWRKDLSLLLPVWILVQVIPQAVGSAIVSGAHIPKYHVSGPALPIAFVAVGLLMSLQAAVVEEVVVLGYLVRRLEQRGWTVTTVIVVAVLVRVSYHLYYGPGVLPIVLWATATVFDVSQDPPPSALHHLPFRLGCGYHDQWLFPHRSSHFRRSVLRIRTCVFLDVGPPGRKTEKAANRSCFVEPPVAQPCRRSDDFRHPA